MFAKHPLYVIVLTNLTLVEWPVKTEVYLGFLLFNSFFIFVENSARFPQQYFIGIIPGQT